MVTKQTCFTVISNRQIGEGYFSCLNLGKGFDCRSTGIMLPIFFEKIIQVTNGEPNNILKFILNIFGGTLYPFYFLVLSIDIKTGYTFDADFKQTLDVFLAYRLNQPALKLSQTFINGVNDCLLGLAFLNFFINTLLNKYLLKCFCMQLILQTTQLDLQFFFKIQNKFVGIGFENFLD